MLIKCTDGGLGGWSRQERKMKFRVSNITCHLIYRNGYDCPVWSCTGGNFKNKILSRSGIVHAPDLKE